MVKGWLTYRCLTVTAYRIGQTNNSRNVWDQLIPKEHLFDRNTKTIYCEPFHLCIYFPYAFPRPDQTDFDRYINRYTEVRTYVLMNSRCLFNPLTWLTRVDTLIRKQRPSAITQRERLSITLTSHLTELTAHRYSKSACKRAAKLWTTGRWHHGTRENWAWIVTTCDSDNNAQ